MGSIVAENRKSLMLFSGRGFPELAEEIGQVLGIAEGTSKSQVHKARMRLRGLLTRV